MRHFDEVRHIQTPSGMREVLWYVWRSSELSYFYDLHDDEPEDLGEVIDITDDCVTLKWAVRYDYPGLTHDYQPNRG